MEFDINIKKESCGKIIIEDYSREYNQYFSEEETIQDYNFYKYSECKTINVIKKINLNKITIFDVLIHDHDQLVQDPINPENYIYDLEKSEVVLKEDGYYIIQHMIIPTNSWYENTYLNQSDEYKSHFNNIYIINSENKLKKLIDNVFEECEFEEIFERNLIGTNIHKCTIDVFYTGFLQECYINYCKILFDKLIKNCNHACVPENNKQISYTRDFLWMVLNIIDYQISFKQYMEAQRILEITNYCGNFCKNYELHEPKSGCRCS